MNERDRLRYRKVLLIAGAVVCVLLGLLLLVWIGGLFVSEDVRELMRTPLGELPVWVPIVVVILLILIFKD